MSDWKEYRKTETVRAMLLSEPEDVPKSGRVEVVEDHWGDMVVDVETLEGVLRVSFPFYLVEGIEGEFYPVDRRVFEDSYVEVGEGS